MKVVAHSLAIAATLLPLSLMAPAKADTTQARCDIYPLGEDRATAVVPCTFSQNQGYVTITLEDGTTYELTPAADRPAAYTDQDGNNVFREDDLGEAGLIYRFATESIYVYWNATVEDSSAPRQGSGNVPCSAYQPTYDSLCAITVTYGGPGNSSMALTAPDGYEYMLTYYDNQIHSPDPNVQISVNVSNGQYYVDINDGEFFILDETIVTGID